MANVEVLIHVEAPSREVDDAFYHILSRMYNNFEPVYPFLSVKSKGPHDEANDAGCFRGELQMPTPSGLLTAESHELSFWSVLDNKDSPPLMSHWNCNHSKDSRDLSYNDENMHQSHASPPGLPDGQYMYNASMCLSTLPSQISNSFPMPQPATKYISPTRILDNYVVQATQYFSEPQSGTKSSHPCNAYDSFSSSRGSVSKPPYLSRQKRVLEEGEQLDTTLVSGSPEHPHLALDLVHCSPRELDQGIFHHNHNSVHKTSSATVTSLSSPPPLAACLEVWPPPAPVGISAFPSASLSPSTLKKLGQDLSSRYQPKPHRQINPYERGYWLLDCTTWSPAARISFWDFLASYIQAGLAGWGVWAQRCSSYDEVRMFCWGSCVKDVYLLLYLASGRGLKFTIAKWIDSSGDVTIRMPLVSSK